MVGIVRSVQESADVGTSRSSPKGLKKTAKSEEAEVEEAEERRSQATVELEDDDGEGNMCARRGRKKL
ncbi:Hypothetical protein NTJ_06430 [Nesidiocoris tenuis]|uniref:Uncharacterized protein n=1 Tax=Nesidiocoris tenuis TaxID=355587 RepID=A0ABN7AN19_9HEMI|nr:Hypothetical protein NTJ_06430 [Nesidiocoris tenuis]